MPTFTPVGLATQTGVGLTQNPSYTQSWRDASSTHAQTSGHTDMFDNTRDAPESPPWISEHTLQLSDPKEYTERVKASTLVHTGGTTTTAFVSHHTFMRPKVPVSTMRSLNLTQMESRTIGFTPGRYEPLDDPALIELNEVAAKVAPHMEAVVNACDGYHLHCPKDGWITTAGFVVSSHKGGLHLSRAEFLALERAVPKDTLGRINYRHVAQVVHHFAEGHAALVATTAAAGDAQAAQ